MQYLLILHVNEGGWGQLTPEQQQQGVAAYMAYGEALRKAIANRDVALAELGLARFEHALAARARSLAHGLHAAHAKSEAAREVAERFSALKETFLAREPAGISPLLETRVIEAAELALQRRATECALAVQEALVELNQLRGASPDAPLRLARPALDDHLDAGLTQWPQGARRNRHAPFTGKSLFGNAKSHAEI